VARAHPAVIGIARALCAVLLACSAAACSARQAPPPWIGTWRMIAVESRDSAAGPWRRPFGDAPSGMVMYNADGTHAMNFGRTPVVPMFAAGTDRGGTESELRAAFEGYFSWYGRYTVDTARGIITHRIEGSLWPSWRNTTQERPFLIRGDTLLLGDLVKSRRVLVRAR
jgi:Lipocalin-like domain